MLGEQIRRDRAGLVTDHSRAGPGDLAVVPHVWVYGLAIVARKACVGSPMHTQTAHRNQTDAGGFPPRLSGGQLDALQGRAIRLIAEQHAIPLDQLGRFLRSSQKKLAGALEPLEDAGLLISRRFLVDEPSWYWLTYRGIRLSGVGVIPYAPKLSTLRHRRAVNDVRLYVTRRAQRGHWERPGSVARRLDPDDFIPDAVFHFGGERHAIEVELTRKSPRRARQIITAHSRRFDAVVYFCGPATRSLLDRLARERRWPNLVVRDLPRPK
jgi:hypothetical protein